jgi:hypothetical protein
MLSLDKLKYYICQRLEALTDIGVYDAKPSDKAAFPYLIYTFTESDFTTRRRVDRYLEIDYWNNENDDSGILQASHLVKYGKYDVDGVTLLVPGLDFSQQNESEGFYHCYCDKENEIPDTEPNISRIYQRYVLKIG